MVAGEAVAISAIVVSGVIVMVEVLAEAMNRSRLSTGSVPVVALAQRPALSNS